MWACIITPNSIYIYRTYKDGKRLNIGEEQKGWFVDICEFIGIKAKKGGLLFCVLYVFALFGGGLAFPSFILKAIKQL